MLQFHNDGTFRVMQIADTQELPRVSPDTLKLLRLALKKEKPDLAVFTGDQIYGMLPAFKGNTRTKVQRAISSLSAPLEEAGVPFLVTFGNHDRQCGIPNAEQIDMYAQSPLFLGGSYAGGEETGVAAFPIADASGKPRFALYLFDSNAQLLSGAYEPVNAAQITKFRQLRDELAEQNGGFLPALAFQHIPVPEFMQVLLRVPKNTKGAVEAFRIYKNQFFVLPEEAEQAGGFMHESPAIPDENGGELEALCEKGDVLGLFVGHDHINSFVLPYGNIDLGYTQGAGFHVYGPGRQRGVRIFDITTDGSYETHTCTFGELTDDPVANPLFEFLQQHAPTSAEQVKRLALRLAAPACATTAAAALLIQKQYKNHRNI